MNARRFHEILGGGLSEGSSENSRGRLSVKGERAPRAIIRCFVPCSLVRAIPCSRAREREREREIDHCTIWSHRMLFSSIGFKSRLQGKTSTFSTARSAREVQTSPCSAGGG